MLKDIWLVIRGKLSWAMVISLTEELGRAEFHARINKQRADEAVRLYNEGEIARKQSSDALANKVIEDIKQSMKEARNG